jgi:hypothetical protein
MYGSFGNDVRVQAVAEVYRVDVVAARTRGVSQKRGKVLSKGRNRNPTATDPAHMICAILKKGVFCRARHRTYHSRSLYIMVKKTWRKRLTAFISTAKRYNHASPDIFANGTNVLPA